MNDYSRHERKRSRMVAVLSVGLTVLAAGLSLWLAGPPPPKKITIATGVAGGAYDSFGKLYKERLERMGLGVELLESHGAVENLQLLANGKADLAFTQGGLTAKMVANKAAITGIGALYLEPVWVFFIPGKGISRLSDLKGRNVLIGPAESGTDEIARVLLLATLPRLSGEPTPVEVDALVARSLVAQGDSARLMRAFEKAGQGGKFVVGVIGGSITQGAKATAPEKRYPGLVAQWWRETFPKAEVKLVNAGIGATGSNYGALRAQRDLLSTQPDFVIVEYSCNDRDVPASAETLEGLLRQILKQPNHPAVLLLFMTRRDGGNTQSRHARIGSHYHLPMVSFRDGLWPGVQSGALKMDDFLADEVHPNDYGHSIAARCVTHLLSSVRASSGGSPAAISEMLPDPLTSTAYEHTGLQ